MKESNQEIVKNLFPERLRNLRTERGISQADMAGAINISRVSLSYYENGERTPDIGILSKIAKYFDVSYDYLLGESSCKNRENIDIERVTGLKEKAIEAIKENFTVIPKKEALNFLLQDIEFIEDLCSYLFSSSYEDMKSIAGDIPVHNLKEYGMYALACSIEKLTEIRRNFSEYIKSDTKLYKAYLSSLVIMYLDEIKIFKANGTAKFSMMNDRAEDLLNNIKEFCPQLIEAVELNGVEFDEAVRKFEKDCQKWGKLFETIENIKKKKEAAPDGQRDETK